MDVESLAIVARPRQTWEAVDLGFRLVRQHWRPVAKAWLLVALPVFLLALLTGLWSAWFPLAVLWWFKPLLDRPVLFVLSRAVFGVVPSGREALRALPGILRSASLWGLGFARIGTDRAFVLPLRMLEGVRGADRRRRLSALRRSARRAAHTYTEAVLVIELVLFICLAVVIVWLLPNGLPIEGSLWDVWHEDPPVWLWVGAATLYSITISLTESFYVAGGFALYLNQRIRLEGWDIEIAFRRIARSLPSALMRRAA